MLKYIGAQSVRFPQNFSVHKHLKKTHCDARVKRLEEGTNLDWSTAEALAFGSLLYQGTEKIRLAILVTEIFG